MVGPIAKNGAPFLTGFWCHAFQGELCMRLPAALQTHSETIRRVTLGHRVTDVPVFGSVVYGDDTEGSDLDIETTTPFSHPNDP